MNQDNIPQIPEHHSPVNHIMSEVRGEKYLPLRTLEEAKAVPDGVVILEGDWGGTVYATCPVKYLEANHQEIEALCQSLEKSFWNCNFHDDVGGGAGVYYVRKAIGSGVWGGMGGGIVLDGLWIHSALGDLAQEVVKGLKYRPDAPKPQQEEEDNS